MKLNDEYITRIEKITNLGAGIARIEGFVVFVENSCPDDVVKVKITKINKNFAIGEIIEIIHPSSDRVEPFCPMYKVCGACQIQNIKYEKQLEIKKEITQDAMKNIAHLDINIPNTIPSPKIKNYRHKIQYPVSQTKVSGRILAGYYKPKTHDLVNIKHCPIQPEICDKIIEFIRVKCFEDIVKKLIPVICVMLLSETRPLIIQILWCLLLMQIKFCLNSMNLQNLFMKILMK